MILNDSEWSNVYLENKTWLTICAYSLLESGGKSKIHNTIESFVTTSSSIV